MKKEPWPRVTKANPCKICGRGDYCLVSPDGMAYICPRTPNNHPVGTKSAGFLHRLGQAHRLPPRTTPRKPPTVPQDAPKADLGALLRGWQAATPAERLDAHAAALGVLPWTLRALGACWAPEHGAWAFPMRGADREIIGIRLRDPSNGRKWAVTGSKNGLFIPDGVPGDQVDVLMICEGPTTCSALLSLNFSVIGRASCSTGAELLFELLRHDPRHVVIAGDEDSPKARPDGSTFLPGQDGADALAKALLPVAKSVKVIFPLKGKDMRDYITKYGATRAMVDCLISNSLEVRA